MTLTLTQAEAIIDGTLTEARKQNASAMAVIVLDTGGHPIAFKREDGASLYRHTIANAKAMGALGMGMDTRDIAARAKNNQVFYASLTTIDGIELALSPGGNLVRDDQGRLLGAVGISGDLGDVDEACVIAGIAAAHLFSGVKK
jgi:uncharacterized protein GlcG (DUF336 family)